MVYMAGAFIWAISSAPCLVLNVFNRAWVTHIKILSQKLNRNGKSAGEMALAMKACRRSGAPGSTKEERAESPTLSSGPNTHTTDHAPQKHTKLIITTELKKDKQKRTVLPKMTCGIMIESHTISFKDQMQWVFYLLRLKCRGSLLDLNLINLESISNEIVSI